MVFLLVGRGMTLTGVAKMIGCMRMVVRLHEGNVVNDVVENLENRLGWSLIFDWNKF